LIGSTFSHYEILERLGGAEETPCYRARDLRRDGFPVFVRFCPPRRSGAGDPAAEVESAVKLVHPGICSVREAGTAENGRPFLVMAWHEGERLDDRLRGGPLRPEDAVDAAAQVADALTAAHGRGVVHRRLEPGSILLCADGRVRVLDFGLAALTGPPPLFGTAEPVPPYRAPEQQRGEAGEVAADVWALGAVLFEMLIGRPPRVAGDGEPEPLPVVRGDLGRELSRIVDRALSARPRDRYAAMNDMLLDVQSLVGTGALGSRETLMGLRRLGPRAAARPTPPTSPAGSPTLDPETPPDGAAARPRVAGMIGMSGMIGRSIHQYTIREHLGGGGMGVVYKADDTRLERTVALKFLPPELTRDPVAKARFLQEARAASALDHPNICTIHEVGETDDGQLFLAMTCYDGETLKRRIEHGALPLLEALDIAKQIAQGLAKAHRLGIVHRDIKPANIIVTTDGIVKILDFGLAKLAGAAGLTRAGFCLGTPAYMSPEQARGEVDHRTDLWSLGVVLYEMVTGSAPFTGDSDQAIIYSLLTEEPKAPSLLRPDVPPELERVLQGMLAKDPGDRYPTVEAALADLRVLTGSTAGAAAFSGSSGPSLQLPARGLRPWMKASLGALAVLLAAGAVVAWLLLRPAPAQQLSFNSLTDQEGREMFPSLSPAGDVLVYAKAKAGEDLDIYWQRTAGGNPIDLTADSPFADTQPAFSPDGKQIAFRSERDGGGLFLMGATGESVRRLTDFGYNPAWSPDGLEIVCASEAVDDPLRRSQVSQLWRVRVADGFKRQITRNDAVQPSWSPHSKRIAYWGLPPGATRRVIWTIPLEGPLESPMDGGRPEGMADGGVPVPVVDDGHINWNPVWSPDGRYLYYVSDRIGSPNLWRVRIDEDSGKALADPEALTTPAQWSGQLSIAADGRRIAYATRDGRSNLERIPFHRETGAITGPAQPVTQGSTRLVRSGDVSPDGQWIVYDTSSPQEDLFVVRTDGTGTRQITNDAFKDRVPRWSPLGDRILFYSDRTSKSYEAWTIRPDGSGMQQVSAAHGETMFEPIWAADGKRILYSLVTRAPEIVDTSLPAAGQTPVRLPPMADEGNIFLPTSWSPDGKRLIGTILGTRKEEEIALFSFASNTYQTLPVSGNGPVWLDDAHAIFLRDGSLELLDTATGASRKLMSPPERSAFKVVAVARDGRSLFVVREIDEGDIKMLEMR
jgi:serine/threonine protein kinase/Tol biopolymer transport system component